jgi:hypothetical protein
VLLLLLLPLQSLLCLLGLLGLLCLMRLLCMPPSLDVAPNLPQSLIDRPKNHFDDRVKETSPLLTIHQQHTDT